MRSWSIAATGNISHGLAERSSQVNSLIAIIPIAAGAYVATNLDNFVLLVSLLARYRSQTGRVVAGYFACMAILGFAGYWIGVAASVAPVEYLGLLGIVPISIGTYELYQLRYGAANKAVAASETAGEQKVFLTTLISQLGNGADTIVALVEGTLSCRTYACRSSGCDTQ